MAIWEECSGYEVALIQIVPAWIHACDLPGNVSGERRHWGGLGSGHSVARWSAPQLEQGYEFLVVEGGVIRVGVAARTSGVPL